MNLFAAYKKKRYANGGIVSPDAVPDIAGPAADAIMPGMGGIVSAVGNIQGGIIDSIDKGDPLTGRQSVLSYVAKGNAKGGTIGAAIGLMNGLKAKRQAGALLNEDLAARETAGREMSAARLGTDPTLYQGYKNASYFDTGGTLGGEDPPGTTVPPRQTLMNDWNNFVDFLGKKGLAGNPKLNNDKDFNVQVFNEYRKANPKAVLTYDQVPAIQKEFINYRNFAINDVRAGKKFVSGADGKVLSQDQLRQQFGDNLDGLWPELSKVDGWVGEKTSKWKFPTVYMQTLDDKGNVVSVENKGTKTTGQFANGGDLEAPLSKAYLQGGNAKSLSSDNVEFQGPSHAQGGIQIPGMGAEVEGEETTAGDYVFSKKLGFAQAHKPIAKAKGVIEKKPATFERINSMKRLAAREQKLAATQEFIKQQLQLQ